MPTKISLRKRGKNITLSLHNDGLSYALWEIHGSELKSSWAGTNYLHLPRQHRTRLNCINNHNGAGSTVKILGGGRLKQVDLMHITALSATREGSTAHLTIGRCQASLDLPLPQAIKVIKTTHKAQEEFIASYDEIIGQENYDQAWDCCE